MRFQMFVQSTLCLKFYKRLHFLPCLSSFVERLPASDCLNYYLFLAAAAAAAAVAAAAAPLLLFSLLLDSENCPETAAAAADAVLPSMTSILLRCCLLLCYSQDFFSQYFLKVLPNYGPIAFYYQIHSGADDFRKNQVSNVESQSDWYILRQDAAGTFHI